MIGAGALSHRGWASDSTGGGGRFSIFIEGLTREAARHLERAQSLSSGREAVLEDMNAFAQTCAASDWDGYGANPISARTLWYAQKLVKALPTGVSMPTVGAEPDGDLTLEWYHNPNWVLSVSVSPEGTLNYAASLGPDNDSPHGSVPFLGQVPDEILRIIERVDRQ